MSRLFEFEDLAWFPNTIRHGGTDFLRFFFTRTRFYEPVAGVLAELMEKTGRHEVLDLCSGSGGNIAEVHTNIEKRLARPITVTLTDKFPLGKFESSTARITYSANPVDALKSIPSSDGVRTMFSAIHHFDRIQVKQILINATATGQPVAIFDGADKNILTFLGIPLVQPVLFMLCTPFIRPFRRSRLIFTYILPLIPLMTMWDGMVSVLRLHSTEELRKLAAAAVPHYEWHAQKLRNRLGFHVTSLTGCPRSLDRSAFQG
jgi:hypothetical protein